MVSNKNEWEGRERMKSRKSLYVTASPAESASLLNRRHEIKTRVYATSSLLPSPSFLACSHSQVSSLSFFFSLARKCFSPVLWWENLVLCASSREFFIGSEPVLILLLFFSPWFCFSCSTRDWNADWEEERRQFSTWILSLQRDFGFSFLFFS